MRIFPILTLAALPLVLGLPSLPVVAVGLIDNPLGPAMDSVIERNVEDAARQAAEQAIEASVEESAQSAVEQTVTESATRGVEQAVEQSVGDSAGQAVEQSVGRAVENAVVETLETSTGQAVQDAVSATVGTGIGEDVAAQAGRQAEQGIQHAVSDSAVEALGRGVENGAGAVVNGAAGLPGALKGNSLPGIANELPQQAIGGQGVAVRAASGETLFYEVEVENRWRAVHSEWLLMIDDRDLQVLEDADVQILERTRLDQLGMTLVRFRVADGVDSYDALRQLLPEDPSRAFDRNHIYHYRPQSGPPSAASAAARSAPLCEEKLPIGIIDTAVNGAHPAFAGAHITQRNFLSPGMAVQQNHGSAVAGILVGEGDGLRALVPNASLSVASVMYRREDGSDGATLLTLLRALDWLAEREVKVINMSLAGPPNRILEKAIQSLVARSDIVIVAAVGNEGPAAPPLYPAAYGEVIGATAVDGERRIYRWANRGEQVDFAAAGVGVQTVAAAGGLAVESGTSMAAPVISAFVACWHRGRAQKAVDQLAARSVDLGEPGRDPVFGAGLLESK